MKVRFTRLRALRGEAKRTVIAGTFSFLLQYPTSLAAQAPTADEIVSHHIEARGGAEKIRGLRTIVYRGTHREGDHVGNAVMALMRPFYKLVGDPRPAEQLFRRGL
jgi:hypothetical protein